MDGRFFKACCSCAILFVAACGADRGPDDDLDDPAESLALLRDAPLTGLASPQTATTARIEQPPQLLPERMWKFDDCSPDRTELFNFGSGDTAFRSVGVTCAPGILGGGVALSAPEDIVYVPDEPYFTFESGVSVAAWFQPTGLDRTQTLFRKRDKGTSAFALMLHRGRFRFVINLGDGKTASVTAPAPARVGVFQHVAASYDGAAVRLYVDGEQVTARTVAGAIPPGPGPLLIGNDGSERRFDGVVDEAAFVLRAMAPAQIRQLTCFPVDPTVSAPAVVGPTTPDVPVTIDIAVTNNNPPACEAMEFDLNVDPSFVTYDPALPILHSPPVASGETTHFTFTATPIDLVDGGSIPVDFQVSAFQWFFTSLGEVVIGVVEPTGCHVNKSRELLIRDPSVVMDPFRTATQGPAGDPRVGAWTFQHLIEQMAPTPADAPDVAEDLVRSYLTPQVINGFTVDPRPGWSDVLTRWPRTANGKLDLARAPFELLAIINRIDLRDLDHGNAGEGSFVFTVVDDRFPVQASLIFEYKLPATTEADVLAWAQAFHALGSMRFSESYNAALQAITERFVRRGARPDGINGSALHAVRSNEFPFGAPDFNFQLREFALSPRTGRLVPAPLDRTPDQSFNSTFTLDDFIATNRDAILAGTQTVPDQFDGHPFRAGAVRNGDPGIWRGFDIDPDAREAFAISTCNGCHSDETGTFFQHIVPPFFFGIGLSPFLTGVTVPDPVTSQPRSFNDLLRRKTDLEAMVCPEQPTVSLRHGIQRVH
jgi:concanavalin A-like lectin/glucanase superfamily protein